MYLCMNIIDSKYALCMQQCTALPGGSSEQEDKKTKVSKVAC